MLMRIRRYRVILIFAIFLVIFLYRFSPLNEWDSVVPIIEELRKENAISHGEQPNEFSPQEESSSAKRPILQFPSSIASAPELKSTTSSSVVAEETIAAPLPIHPAETSVSPKTIPEIDIPDRKPALIYDEQQAQFDEIHALSPGRLDAEYNNLPTTTAIHWTKQTEHFPVPTESIIELPSGKPIAIPKIQYEFKAETAEAKAAREKKRDIVKDEAKRVWASYKKYAWMHDELSPVSAKFRDPFGGWAATLVDSLDTLWIMDLIPEFEEAVKAVDQIDFTTSQRNDIPMFETTIRYLGGLLAAYDISGAKYKSLLDKAAELGEILYSAFDTPNRMPILYYQWKPTFASQPHRASTRAGTAELGSMAMEFTRLAQLTKEPRYYDAIARITNALEEFQNQGTGLPGVFPGDFDASGCNWTKPEPPTPVEEPHGYEPPMLVLPPEPNSKESMRTKEAGKLELQVIDDGAGQSVARIQGWDDNHGENKGRDETTKVESPAKGVPLKRLKRQLSDPSLTAETAPPRTHKSGADKLSTDADVSGAKESLPKVFNKTDWDCTPQGLVAANQQYSMGGGQDSTYEYFPKQYILLGGFEDKYRTMYLKVIDAVRQNMLYRPMLPDNSNILVSGKVTKDNFGHTGLYAEATHLTCFIGGMVGMGAKLFNIENDLEIAKRLTDGCVWAYESMPSGIMPEMATLFPCESVNNCVWNETLYREALDPLGGARDEARALYFQNKELGAQAEAEAQAIRTEAERLALAANAAAETKDAAALEEARRLASAAGTTIDVKDAAVQEEANRLASTAKSASDANGASSADEATFLLNTAKDYNPSSEHAPNTEHPKSKSEDPSHPLQRRQIDMDEEKKLEITHNLADEAYELSKAAQMRGASTNGFTPGAAGIQQGKIPLVREGFSEKFQQTQQELEDQNPRGSTYKSQEPLLNQDPMAPLGHEEFIDNRIQVEGLPAGYVGIQNKKYILRPEAIESVWYMYRITGDVSWQEKGWKMWLSIMKYTRTPYAHSAIQDVTMSGPGEEELPHQDDAMESFWLAETLKYFYLLYSEPDLVSLDEWVLNTEAHPFRRPV